jgi:hypothetical protein
MLGDRDRSFGSGVGTLLLCLACGCDTVYAPWTAAQTLLLARPPAQALRLGPVSTVSPTLQRVRFVRRAGGPPAEVMWLAAAEPVSPARLAGLEPAPLASLRAQPALGPISTDGDLPGLGRFVCYVQVPAGAVAVQCDAETLVADIPPGLSLFAVARPALGPVEVSAQLHRLGAREPPTASVTPLVRPMGAPSEAR